MGHKLLIVGAGRIGAGFNWHDDAYTHAGAAKALKDRIELVGFVETDIERAVAAKKKWEVPVYEDIPTALLALHPDVVSVCTPPENHEIAVEWLTEHSEEVNGIWVEKPCRSIGFREAPPWVQVNYLRRADPEHVKMAGLFCTSDIREVILYVTAKDDIHTRCHFDDLASWWKAELVYLPITSGPCSYLLSWQDPGGKTQERFFPLGGINPGPCMAGMLGNLLDAMEGKSHLWSPLR